MAPDPGGLTGERERDLERRLAEAEETLRAIRNGEVDAVVVSGASGEQVYTLRGADEPYRRMVEGMSEGALTLTPEGLILFSNEQFARMVGCPLERVIGSNFRELVCPEDGPAWRTLLAGGGERKTELRLKAAPGGSIPVYCSLESLTLDGARSLCAIVTDLSEQKRSEEIVASERLARSILEQAAEAILVADPEGRIMRASRAADGLAGCPVAQRRFDEVLQVSLGSGAPCPFGEILAAARQNQVFRDLGASAITADGRRVELMLSAAALNGAHGSLLGCVLHLTDITERKQTEERLRQTQKLESLGLLAGGIAHDFNNLLVGVIGNASLIQEMIPPDGAVADLLDRIVKAGQQAAHLTRQMLAYAGKGRFVAEPVNLSELVLELRGLLQPSLPGKVELQVALARDLPAVEADPGQMQQVVMNLVLNAAEAIGSRSGAVHVRTGSQEIGEEFLAGHPEAAGLVPGRYVFLEVSDTGCGMDEATKARIFDPFFSTKFLGRGLGLAAVAGIVRGHHGAILVKSAPGEGSRFTTFFPACSLPAAASAPRDAAPQAAGGGTVLVVDDEPFVREAAKAGLELRGYSVLLADSGNAALELLERQAGQIALVILDLGMPQLAGNEVLPELVKISPGVRVLVSSGYSETETMRLFQGHRVAGFIQKPYTARALAEKVRACLA